MWSFVPLPWRLGLIGVAVALTLGSAAGFIVKVKHDAYVSGHDVGYSEAAAKCAAEKAAQEAANRKVMEQATKALDALQQKLELKELQVDDILKGIDLAADAAPDAGLCGLDVDSVRRLSTVQ